MKHRLFILLFALILLLTACGNSPKSQPADHVISHRGASDEALEHTRAAYDLAVAYGSHFLEQDLVSSADGTLYISHDLTPERLTGEVRPFSELHDAEIDALQTQDGQRILKLEEVFAAYPEPICFVVELRTQDQLEPLIQLVEKYHVENRMILQAWAVPPLESVRERFPSIRRMLLVGTQDGVDWGCTQDAVQILAMADYLMTESNCFQLRQHGKEVCVWVLNSEEDIRLAIELQVDYYFTDHTALALKLEQERNESENP